MSSGLAVPQQSSGRTLTRPGSASSLRNSVEHEDDLAPLSRSRRNSESHVAASPQAQAPIPASAPATSPGATNSAAAQAGLVPLPTGPMQSKAETAALTAPVDWREADHLSPTDPHTERTPIYIGKNRKVYHVQTSFLKEKSPYFKKMLAEETGHDGHLLAAGPAEFDDLDEFAMNLFVLWLHGGGRLGGPHDFHSLAHYLGLYVLARKFEIEGLENQVMDLVRHYYAEQNMTAPAYRLEYIYTYTHGPNMMRTFLVNTAAFRALEEAPHAEITNQNPMLHKTFYAPGSYISESVKNVLMKNPEMAADFIEALVKLHKLDEKPAAASKPAEQVKAAEQPKSAEPKKDMTPKPAETKPTSSSAALSKVPCQCDGASDEKPAPAPKPVEQPKKDDAKPCESKKDDTKPVEPKKTDSKPTDAAKKDDSKSASKPAPSKAPGQVDGAADEKPKKDDSKPAEPKKEEPKPAEPKKTDSKPADAAAKKDDSKPAAKSSPSKGPAQTDGAADEKSRKDGIKPSEPKQDDAKAAEPKKTDSKPADAAKKDESKPASKPASKAPAQTDGASDEKPKKDDASKSTEAKKPADQTKKDDTKPAEPKKDDAKPAESKKSADQIKPAASAKPASGQVDGPADDAKKDAPKPAEAPKPIVVAPAPPAGPSAPVAPKPEPTPTPAAATAATTSTASTTIKSVPAAEHRVPSKYPPPPPIHTETERIQWEMTERALAKSDHESLFKRVHWPLKFKLGWALFKEKLHLGKKKESPTL